MRRALPRVIGRYRSLSRDRRRLLREAAGRLGLVSAALRLFRFERVIRMGSRSLRSGPVPRDEIANCVWAVEAAARSVPWRAVCIHQGLCLQQMLRKRGVDARLHYGARQGQAPGRPLEAHVWVSVDGEILIGGSEAASFALLATYP